jgi:hypothetical protein
MGGGVPIVDDVLDFGGDIIEGAGDVIGDVVEGVGNVVEDIDPVTLAKIAYTIYTGDPSLALEDMGEEALADVVLNEVGDYATDPSNWMDFLDTGGDALTNIGSDVLTNVGTDAFDPTAFLPGNNPYDPTKQFSDYTRYAKDAYNLYNMLNPSQQSQVQNQFQQGNLYDPNLGNFDYGNALSPFLNYGQQAYNRYSTLQPFANLNPTNFNPMDFLGNLSMKGLEELQTLPGAVATGLGILSTYDQMRVNNLIQKGYDKNEAKNLVYQQKFTTPEGIASLPKQDITGLNPRTAADVVVKPKAAKGGSINDLYNEYSMLNNRMRNYRRLAKGGII